MKRYFSLVLAALSLLVPAAAQSAKKPLGVTVRRNAALATAAGATVSAFTTFDFNWTYTPVWPVCVSKNLACYDGFIATNTVTGATIGTTAQIGPSALSYSYSPAGGVPYGPSSFSFVAHGYDETGKEVVSSPPATVTITVKLPTLNGPQNVQVATQ